MKLVICNQLLSVAGVGGTNISGNAPRFLFERTNAEFFALMPIRQIALNKRLESPASLTLRDMDQLMQNQFAIAPGIGANNDAVSERYSATGASDDLSVSGNGGEFFVFWQRDAIDNQNANPRFSR